MRALIGNLVLVAPAFALGCYGGRLGAMLAFAIAGGVMLVVALLYAELAAAMPQVGGATTQVVQRYPREPRLESMLARLVDDKKLDWSSKVVDLLPSFKLADAATTSQVTVQHTVCACTGMPRQDLEFLFEYDGWYPERRLASMATMSAVSTPSRCAVASAVRPPSTLASSRRTERSRPSK